ncbi:MAG: hypothetical protein NZ930_00380 [Candidatus Bipolaricaulota bacterium]|nr:hypothetical protein [Candidatus Bipolaricaulota bacterium]MDW8031160.1 hypothetical protein [Candidatus Bipolaricaulota bacterium]
MNLFRAIGTLVLAVTLGSLLVQAVSQGPNYASTYAATGWSNASAAVGTPDNTCAERTGAGGGSLDLTGFGFTIPDAAVIQGITVEVDMAATTSNEGVRVRLLKGGSPVGNTQDIYGIAGQTGCSTSAFRTVGGPTDLWGTSWTAADINSANFGVRLSKLGSTNTAYVDAVRITIEYQDVMTVSVISGTALSANVTSASQVENGIVPFIGQTTLQVVATRNWRVCAKVNAYSYPPGADDPTANALQIRDYLGNWQPGGSSVVVGQGAPTPAGGITVTVDQRVLLASFGDGKIGPYQFNLDYSIDGQGVPCP